jgi:membrane fusion protein (multidrug efflux system)
LAGPIAFAAGCKQEVPPPAPPAPVEVVSVAQRDQPIYEEWIGTTDGFVNAEIRAQVTGYLLRQDYTDGAPVQKGDLLFEIDPRPFQATYDQVKANFDKAELDLKRETELYATQAAARQDYDNAVEARLAAKAALEEAELNLGFTRVTSPIEGIAGIALTQIGNLVGPGTGALTTVSTVDPIKVYFSINEQTYLNFKRQYPSREVLRENLPLELILTDGSVYPRKGRVYAADRQIDPNTGTLRIAAEFPNPDRLLRPGQYGKVRAVVRTLKAALLVPQRAVSELQGGYQIATVDGFNRAHIQTVRVGDRVGSLWIVESGLKPGDRVVAEGVQKVKEGAEVDPRPFAAGAAEK